MGRTGVTALAEVSVEVRDKRDGSRVKTASVESEGHSVDSTVVDERYTRRRGQEKGTERKKKE